MVTNAESKSRQLGDKKNQDVHYEKEVYDDNDTEEELGYVNESEIINAPAIKQEPNEDNQSQGEGEKDISEDNEVGGGANDPIYIMTLELERGKADRIKIYSDSNPSELAFEFCKRNNLDFNALKYLTNEIENLLTKFKSKAEECGGDNTDMRNQNQSEQIIEVDEDNLTDKNPQEDIAKEKQDHLFNGNQNSNRDNIQTYSPNDQEKEIESNENLIYCTENEDKFYIEQKKPNTFQNMSQGDNLIYSSIDHSEKFQTEENKNNKRTVIKDNTINNHIENENQYIPVAQQNVVKGNENKDSIKFICEDHFQPDEQTHNKNDNSNMEKEQHSEGISINKFKRNSNFNSNSDSINRKNEEQNENEQEVNEDEHDFEENAIEEVKSEDVQKNTDSPHGEEEQDGEKQPENQETENFEIDGDGESIRIPDGNQSDKDKQQVCTNSQIKSMGNYHPKLFPYEFFLDNHRNQSKETFKLGNSSSIKSFHSGLLPKQPSLQCMVRSPSCNSRGKSNIFERLFHEADYKRCMPNNRTCCSKFTAINFIVNKEAFQEEKKSVGNLNFPKNSKNKPASINYGEFLYQRGMLFKEQKHKCLDQRRFELDMKQNSSSTFHPNTNEFTIHNRPAQFTFNSSEYFRHKNQVMQKIKDKAEFSNSKDQMPFKNEEQRGEVEGSNRINKSINNNYSSHKRSNSFGGSASQKGNLATREERNLNKIEKIRKEFHSQCTFKPKINSNYEMNLNFMERQEVYKEKFQKHKEELTNALNSPHDENGQPLFSPKLTSKSKNYFRGDVFIHNYQYAHKYQSKKDALSRKQFEGYAPIRFKNDTDQILSKLKEEAFAKLFKDLDSDQDNLITPINICTKKVSSDVVKIISPILNELKSENETLTEDEFSRAMGHLFETLNHDEKRKLIMTYKNFNSSKMGKEQELILNKFQPTIDSHSKRLAAIHDKKIALSLTEDQKKSMGKDYVDRDTFFRDKDPMKNLRKSTELQNFTYQNYKKSSS